MLQPSLVHAQPFATWFQLEMLQAILAPHHSEDQNHYCTEVNTSVPVITITP